MNNKGFTLVEVISVIGILLVISLIAIPSMITLKNKNNDKNYEKIKDTIITSAETYYNNYIELGSVEECYITLEEMASQNLIKTPIINPKTNEEIPLTNYVKIYKEKTGEKYKIKYEYIEGTVTNPVMCPTNKVITQTPEQEQEYVDPSGANQPKLADGMIPVIYDEENEIWIKADTTEKWYSYEEQMWANAVTVTEVNRNYYLSDEAIGKEVSMNDINTMWVWIPRYKYKIPSNIGSHSAVPDPPEIDVVFENGTNTTGVDEKTYRAGITAEGTNDNYYTHPAFRDGSSVYNEEPYDIGGWDKELTGIWLSKFAVGGTKDQPMITSNSGLLYDYIDEQFKTSLTFAGGVINEDTGEVTFEGSNDYGLFETTDTHLTKNTEWGAVAILTNSRYGNLNYRDNAPEKYDYDNCTPLTCQDKSSTGNIYGSYIYSNKYVYTMGILGYWDESKSYVGDTNFRGIISDDPENGIIENEYGTSLPTRKYYDKYYNDSNRTYSAEEMSILGDSMFETNGWYWKTWFCWDCSVITPDGPYTVRNDRYSIFGATEKSGPGNYGSWEYVVIVTLIP